MTHLSDPTGRDLIVLGMLTEAAEQGQPCPPLKAMCDRAGWPDENRAWRCLKKLADSGLIEIIGRGRSATIVIAATGKTVVRQGYRNALGEYLPAETSVGPAPDFPSWLRYEDDPEAINERRDGFMPPRPDVVSGCGCALA